MLSQSPGIPGWTGTFFVWKKHFTSWTVTNSCEDALLGTTNPIVFQGPDAVSREELVFHHGQAREASARRAYKEITNAVTNSVLLGKIHELGSSSLGMAEVRRMYVPSDDLDKQSYLREYINAAMVLGEKPETYFERMAIIRENLAEVGIPNRTTSRSYTYYSAFHPTPRWT